MRALAACVKRAYTGAMPTARKIRYRLEWLGLKSAAKFVALLSRKACYRLALLLGSLAATLIVGVDAFWRSPRPLQVSAPRRPYTDNVGIWTGTITVIGS